MGEFHTLELKACDWAYTDEASDPAEPSPSITEGAPDGGLLFSNPSSERATFAFSGPQDVTTCMPAAVGCIITTRGKVQQGTGSMRADGIDLPLNATTWIPCAANHELCLSFECSAQSSVTIELVTIEWQNGFPDFSARCNREANVLVITPDYPSEANLYLCAFAHTRNRLYRERGLKVQALALDPCRTHKSLYEFDGVDVLVGSSDDLEKLILRRQYDIVITHFADMHHYRIFDACITREQLMFIVHGPLETVFPLSPVIARPYFTQPPDFVAPNREKIATVRRYARKPNVSWVFVSDWLRRESEELMGVEFLNSHVIHNSIDETKFPYRQKTAEDRKNILVLRRCDESPIFHSVDIVVRCIWELSTRDFFDDLHFEVVGDGSFFTELTAPLEQFDNVEVIRTFVPNDKIAELHARNGIMLLPSRFDSQGVSIGEAASSGLAVIGSQVTCIPYFLDEESNHTLAPAEDPVAFANIIERLYRNPDEYLAISKRLASRMRALCNTNDTTGREISLIERLLEKARGESHAAKEATRLSPEAAGERASEPVLTIALIEHGSAPLLERCLRTLTDPRFTGDIEVLVSPEGLDGDGLAVLGRYAEALPSTVKPLCGTPSTGAAAIATAIQQASGTFLRFARSSSWADHETLAPFIDVLSHAQADLVVTDDRRIELGVLMPRRAFPLDNLHDGGVYQTDLLTYPRYGFDGVVPSTAVSTYRTSRLREATVPISPETCLALSELEVLAFEAVDTVRYARLPVFWDISNRPGENVPQNRDYLGIRQSMINIIDSLAHNHALSERRRDFIIKNIVVPAIVRSVVECDRKCEWGQLDRLTHDLENTPELRGAILEGIAQSDWRATCILDSYRSAIETHATEPLISADGATFTPPRTVRDAAHSIVRGAIPDGILKWMRSRTDPGNAS